MPVVNLVPLVRQIWNRPMKAAKNWVARDLSGRYLRHAPRLIAESDDLKASIVHRWRVPPSRIEVVGLGVDRALFHPTDQDQARRGCGIDPDRTVLMYVGALDRAHDLGPVIAAITRLGDSPLELHLVGDGEYRAELERAAVEGMLKDRLARYKEVHVRLKDIQVQSLAGEVAAVATAAMTRELGDGVTTITEAGALTIVLRREGDHWLIVTEHYSFRRGT